MKISELIALLEQRKEEWGDVDVRVHRGAPVEEWEVVTYVSQLRPYEGVPPHVVID